MLSMEDLIFGIATSGVPNILMLLTIAMIFDFARMLLFDR